MANLGQHYSWCTDRDHESMGLDCTSGDVPLSIGGPQVWLFGSPPKEPLIVIDLPGEALELTPQKARAAGLILADMAHQAGIRRL